jgi:thioredoxin-dependent peroxiredoxin
MNLGLIVGLFTLATPKAGDVAPDFTAKDTDGHSYSLSEMLKKGPVILAFFPKSSTSG